MTREEILAKLASGECTITFTKVSDGTTRTMKCTRKLDLIPNDHLPKGGMSTRKENEETIRAFDLDKVMWRSFRVANVTAIE